jgi:SIR2-like domain
VASSLDDHARTVVRELLARRVVVFLGPGVNLCGRPAELTWSASQYDWLPDDQELAAYLGDLFSYRGGNEQDLARIAQWVSLTVGTYPLYSELRRLLDRDYPPTAVHRFLASVPAASHRYPLIVTANTDDLLERALRDAGEPFDLVSYVPEGWFRHHPHEGEPVSIPLPNQYQGISIDTRTVILKLLGTVDRTDESRDSFVVTEDNYISYLTRSDVSNLIPAGILALLRSSPYVLFLGYGLRSWYRRVVLSRLWGESRLRFQSWAVQRHPDPVDRELWNFRGTELVDVGLEEYTEALHTHLSEAEHG